MNKTAHTTGPWEVSPEKEMRQQAQTGGIAIKAYSSRYDQYVALFNITPNETFGGIDSAISNAKLVAAAPDLVAALLRSLSWLTSYPGGGAKNVYEQAREALLKAGVE